MILIIRGNKVCSKHQDIFDMIVQKWMQYHENRRSWQLSQVRNILPLLSNVEGRILVRAVKKIFNYLLVLSHGSDMLVEIWYDRKWVSIPWKWLECFYWILNREQEHFDICSGGKSLHEQQWGSKNLTSVAMKSIFQTLHILQKGFFCWQWIKLKKVIQSNMCRATRRRSN